MAAALIAPQRLTLGQYLWVAAQIVEAAHGAIATDAGADNVRGPFVVDLASMVAAGVDLVGDTVRREQLRQAIRTPYVDGDSALAIHCLSNTMHCTVNGDGVFLRVDRAWFQEGRLIAKLSVFWNYRNTVSTRSLCPQTWRFVFERSGEDWYLTSHDLESTC
jgi:hypothetical protein